MDVVNPPAQVSASTPTADTPAGSAGSGPTVSGASHSHPRSGIYLAFQNATNDGLLFQRVQSGTITTSNAVGSIFDASSTLSWPATFATTPVCQATQVSSTGAAWGGTATSASTTQVTAGCSGPRNTDTGVIEVWGIG